MTIPVVSHRYPETPSLIVANALVAAANPILNLVPQLRATVQHPDPAARVIPGTGTDGYIEELRYFIDAIANQRAPSVVNAEDGLKAVELCEAEEKSVRTGQRVGFV